MEYITDDYLTGELGFTHHHLVGFRIKQFYFSGDFFAMNPTFSLAKADFFGTKVYIPVIKNKMSLETALIIKEPLEVFIKEINESCTKQYLFTTLFNS